MTSPSSAATQVIVPPAGAVEAPAKTFARERVDFIEYFRGIAIVLIASGHAIDAAWARFADDGAATSWSGVIPALVNGGTLYFVFISGFLYRYVFHGRVPYGDFMGKKALNVGLPYLALGLPLAIAHLATSGFHTVVLKHGEPYAANWFVDLVVEMSTGSMMIAYWYIPFIFIVFLASPLFDVFIRMPNNRRLPIFAATLLLAFWVHRPVEEMNPVHAFVYFLNIYLFGMLVCEYRHRLLPILRRPAVLVALALSMLAVALVQTFVVDFAGSLERAPGDGWLPLGFDWMLVQKYAGVLFFCGLLARVGDRGLGGLRYLAAISFGIFFVHGIVVSVLSHMPDLLPRFDLPVMEMALYSVITVGASVMIVAAIRFVAGRQSRYLIGC